MLFLAQKIKIFENFRGTKIKNLCQFRHQNPIFATFQGFQKVDFSDPKLAFGTLCVGSTRFSNALLSNFQDTANL